LGEVDNEVAVLSCLATAGALVAAAAIPVALWSAQKTGDSLLEMRKAAHRIGAGTFSCELGVSTIPELTDLATDLNTMSTQLEDRLRGLTHEKSELHAILASMSEGVLVVDAHGRIRLANDALQQQFQVGNEINGKTVLEVFRNIQLDTVVTEALRNGSCRNRELTTFNIGEQWFEVKASALRETEGKGVVVVLHDITRVKQLEAVRKDFVANVSHELRTPLSIIKGYVETLLDPQPPNSETARKFLQIVKKHSSRLETLIGDLLSISSLESQQNGLHLETVVLHSLLQTVLTDLALPIKEKRILVETTIPEALAAVEADGRRLYQVWFNLVDNAVKYTPANGRVTVSARRKNGEIECCVEDNGPGIAPEHLSRVFERFYRVDKARSRELGGTGLGLAIVKHIVQAHGGRVWVESRVGEGSAFYFTLPATR
jgi:two-component system phosphate regulon sensor histidine kinase PhoR